MAKPKSTQIEVNINNHNYKIAHAVIKKLGYTDEDVINMTFAYVSQTGGMPPEICKLSPEAFAKIKQKYKEQNK